MFVVIVMMVSVSGLKTKYDLRFAGNASEFVEYNDVPELKELTVSFWMKSSDKSKTGTILSYSVPGKRNALTLAQPNRFLVYINSDEIESGNKYVNTSLLLARLFYVCSTSVKRR